MKKNVTIADSHLSVETHNDRQDSQGNDGHESDQSPFQIGKRPGIGRNQILVQMPYKNGGNRHDKSR